MDPHVGQVILFAGTFTPVGWAVCDGATYKVSDYPDAYKLLGNQFGGTPGSTFCVPDLRGCLPIGAGAGPGLTLRKVNDRGGAWSATLTADNLPSHGHAMQGATGPTASQLTAVDTRFCANTVLVKGKVQSTGKGMPFSIAPPWLGIHYLIALKGAAPPAPPPPPKPPPAPAPPPPQAVPGPMPFDPFGGPTPGDLMPPEPSGPGPASSDPNQPPDPLPGWDPGD